MSGPENWIDEGVVELSQKDDQRVREMIDQADRDIEEARVNFRWTKKQLDVVRQAADLIGIPYQTYIKDAVFHRALDDLSTAKKIGIK